MRIFIILALLTFSACGGDSPSLLDDSDLGTDQNNNSGTGRTNNIVFPKEDMGSTDLGTCTEGAQDLPDNQFFDANCDGIDGDIEDSIFVAKHGDDLNPGTKALPKKSIQAGIDEAKITSKSWVLVGDGQHDGGFKLEDGISIAGGFGFGWKRSRGSRTSVRGGSPAVLAVDINSPTTIISLDIQPGPSDPGQSALTIAVQNSSGLRLEKLTLQGGIGGDGADGTKGTKGSDGARGSNGGNAPKDSNSFGICKNKNNPPSVGPGAPATCGDNGGGAGGKSGFKKNSGKKGGDSVGGGEGGGGGPGYGPGVTGGFGNSGSLGETGAGALPGGNFTLLEWEGTAGSTGEDGNPGAGGGGGGGGGGGYESLGCDSWGGAGAGGGSGGCGGTGGQGGEPGGASVVLFLVNSPETVLVDCRLLGGQGGRGGSGGAGGPGGVGGDGGTGGNNEENSGDGAKGGIGGSGGIGGTGGAGSGGPSFGLYMDLELVTTPVGTDIMEGFGGEGGSSASAEGRGAKGIAEAIHTGIL